jgi:hypothetical protein
LVALQANEPAVAVVQVAVQEAPKPALVRLPDAPALEKLLGENDLADVARNTKISETLGDKEHTVSDIVTALDIVFGKYAEIAPKEVAQAATGKRVAFTLALLKGSESALKEYEQLRAPKVADVVLAPLAPVAVEKAS